LSDNPEPQAVASGCYMQLTRIKLSAKGASSIRSLPLAVLQFAGFQEFRIEEDCCGKLKR